MNRIHRKTIDLTEYDPRTVTADAVPFPLGERLWRQYDEKGGQVRVEFPSPKTNGCWRLTALGWVGTIPLSPEFGLRLRPKVSLSNLFRMWEVAYALKSFHLLDGTTEAGSLTAFYERLAHVLAQRTLARGRQGFYRAYLAQTERLPYVRGQLKVRPGPRRTHAVRLTCHYQEHTADIPDNQILLYTLGQIARSQRCRGQVQATVRRAYHTLQGIVTSRPYQPWDCIGRSYNRLNQDYQPLHALCRFFLEHTGPTHHVGERTMMPFLVNMARLFELFVAQWLKAYLPAPWQLKAQERVSVGANDDVQFDIDLVLYDGNGRARAVLDTKYKTPEQTNNPDFNQIVTYAKAKGCRQAILIYPTPLAIPLDVHLDDLHVRSLTFALDGDLEVAGQQFLRTLLTRTDDGSGDGLPDLDAI